MEQERANADLLDCGGQLQAQLNNLVLGTGEVTDPSQRGSVMVKKEKISHDEITALKGHKY